MNTKKLLKHLYYDEDCVISLCGQEENKFDTYEEIDNCPCCYEIFKGLNNEKNKNHNS